MNYFIALNRFSLLHFLKDLMLNIIVPLLERDSSLILVLLLTSGSYGSSGICLYLLASFVCIIIFMCHRYLASRFCPEDILKYANPNRG